MPRSAFARNAQRSAQSVAGRIAHSLAVAVCNRSQCAAQCAVGRGPTAHSLAVALSNRLQCAAQFAVGRGAHCALARSCSVQSLPMRSAVRSRSRGAVRTRSQLQFAIACNPQRSAQSVAGRTAAKYWVAHTVARRQHVICY